jgi:hypothetical protein
MTNKPQKIVVHKHAAKRLFHVSIHNVDSKAANTTWQGIAGKSRYAYEQGLVGNYKNDRVLTGGLMLAFVNTQYEGWETQDVEGEFPNMIRAAEHKEQVADQLIQEGLTNVGVRNVNSKRDPSSDGMGSNWNAKFNPNRMTMAKVNEKIDWINTSLQMNISRDVRSRALRAVIGANGNVDSMAGLLRFIRQEMGLV